MIVNDCDCDWPSFLVELKQTKHNQVIKDQDYLALKVYICCGKTHKCNYGRNKSNGWKSNPKKY